MCVTGKEQLFNLQKVIVCLPLSLFCLQGWKQFLGSCLRLPPTGRSPMVSFGILCAATSTRRAYPTAHCSRVSFRRCPKSIFPTSMVQYDPRRNCVQSFLSKRLRNAKLFCRHCTYHVLTSLLCSSPIHPVELTTWWKFKVPGCSCNGTRLPNWAQTETRSRTVIFTETELQHVPQLQKHGWAQVEEKAYIARHLWSPATPQWKACGLILATWRVQRKSNRTHGTQYLTSHLVEQRPSDC